MAGGWTGPILTGLLNVTSEESGKETSSGANPADRRFRTACMRKILRKIAWPVREGAESTAWQMRGKCAGWDDMLLFPVPSHTLVRNIA